MNRADSGDEDIQKFRAVSDAETEHQIFISLAENSSEFFGVFDLNLKQIYVNPAGMRLVGLDSLEQAKQASVLDYFFDEDREFIKGEFFEKVGRDGFAETEIRFRHFQTGEAVWMIYTVFIIKDEQGEPIGYGTVSRNIDERRQVENFLVQSEKRYRNLFDSIDEGFCIVEVLFDERERPFDYRFLEINPVFEKLTALENAVGKTAREMIPNLEDHWIETYGRVAKTRQPERFANSSEAMGFWFDVYAFPIDAPDENRVAILFNNITERKLIEAENKRLGERNREILESITDGFAAIDRDWRLTYFNRQAGEILDQTSDELIGKSVWEVYPGIVGSIFEEHYRRVAAEKVPVTFTAFYPDHNRYYEVSAYPAQNGITIYFRNVSERLEAEENLKTVQDETERQRRLYEAILSNTPDLAYIWGLDHRFTYANEGLLQMWGKTWDEAIGKNCLELGYEPWHAEMHDREIEEVVATKKAVRGTVPFNGAFGRRIYDYILVPVIGADGEVEAVAGTTRDITERTQREMNAVLLADITDNFSRLSSAAEIMQMVGAKVKEFLNISTCLFAEVDEENDRVSVEWAWSGDADVPNVMGVYRLSEFVTEKFQDAARRGETIVVRDTQNDSLTDAAAYAAFDIHSFISVPFRREGKWKYLFTVNSAAARDWQDEEIKLVSDITSRTFPRLERARAEAELRETNAVLNAINLNTPTLIYVKDRESRILSANPATCAVIGKTLPEIIGKNHAEYMGDEAESTLIRANDRRIIEGGKTETFEETVVQPDGKPHIFLSTKTPYRGEQDAIIGLIGVSVDITERKRAEDRLNLLAQISELARRFENPNELLYEVAAAVGEHLEVKRCLFNEIDLDADIETVHRDYFRGAQSVAGRHKISDYSPVTSAEMKAGKIVVNEDSKTDPRTAADYEKTYAPSGERAYVAVPLMRENRWVASLWVSDDTPRQWNQQEVSLLETVAERVWSVVEKLRIDTTLRESEERLRLATNAAEMFAWETNYLDQTIKWSDNAAKVIGCAPEDLSDDITTGSFFVAPEDVAQLTSGFEELLEKGETHYIFEFRGSETGDARRFWQAQGLVIYDEEKNPLRVVGVTQNITARKRAEQERERLFESERLLRSEAEAANRVKDEFLATVSHELRTPLNAILGWATMLRSGKLGGEQIERAVETVERSARAQSQLIDDLLDISRIITGKLRLEISTLDLSEVIMEAVEAMRPAAEAKEIRLQTMLDSETGLISGDGNRLQQVVWNLVSNAVKFTPKGGRVQIRLERINSHVEIIVSDTGKGIETDFLPFVFDRFRQADQTTTRQYGGLGLGLSIVRQLVEMHGGTVHAESVGEDEGTTFIVKLPRMIALYPATGDTGEHVHISTAPEQNIEIDDTFKLSGLKILIVDDEPDSREILRVVLMQSGATVASAASASEAVKELARNDFDVLVSDIGMPVEDGYALIGKVRRQPANKNGRIPAIALTAYARVEDRVRALNAGFQAHIPKPVEPVELIAVIVSLVKGLGKD